MKYVDVRRRIPDVILLQISGCLNSADLYDFIFVISLLCVHDQAVVCGIFRSGMMHFHPCEDEVLTETDKVSFSFFCCCFPFHVRTTSRKHFSTYYSRRIIFSLKS